MTKQEHEINSGMKWIAERFAEVLGVTPEALDWEQHSAGALLQVPVSSDSIHYICFDKKQIADHGNSRDWQTTMQTWIGKHAKEAQRSPSSKQDPHKCPVDIE